MEGSGEAVTEVRFPPGFRFHPTDEELITYYLINKIADAQFTGRAIGDVDLNKSEPWDLPGQAKMGEKEWYFFSLRDRKYPTGVRTNRATNTGYWKTTGKDKEIYNSSTLELVGMKKTLVFYRGKSPRGEKTNWIMHEYRRQYKSGYRTSKQDEWIVCRIFQKNPGLKKYPSNPSKVANTTHSHHLQTPQNPMPSQVMMQPENFQFLGGSINYMNPPELIGAASTSTNMINLQPPPQAHHGSGGGTGTGGCFAISGLNLNLGGIATSMGQAVLGISQTNVTFGMMNNGTVRVPGGDQTDGGYGGDNSSASTTNNRFLGMDQSVCADLDSYWPCY